jgi:hypothetical protein
LSLSLAAPRGSYRLVPTLNDQFISSSLEYTKPVVNPPYLENITAPPQTFSTMRISSLTDPTVELDHSTPAGRQDIFATGTYDNGAAISAEIFDLANVTAQPLREIVNISFNISFQPQSQIIIKKSTISNNGVGKSLGLSVSNGNLFNLRISIKKFIAAAD